jgi:hypothetical protein
MKLDSFWSGAFLSEKKTDFPCGKHQGIVKIAG